MSKSIPPENLVIMDEFCLKHPLKIDLVYKDAAHPENIFQIALYKQNAPFVLHKDLAKIVLEAATIINQRKGWILVLKDGLRPVEAQERMMETPIVKAHPEWLAEPNRMLSPPGAGAHPRAMAVDVCVIQTDGQPVDMGTPFDSMTPQSARDYQALPEGILDNRRTLETAMRDAAARAGHTLLPLNTEWWDFRFPKEVYAAFAPLSNDDLPLPFKML